MEIDECLCQLLTGQLEKEPYLIQKLQMPVRYLSHQSMQVDECINLLLRRAKSTERRNRKVFHIKRLLCFKKTKWCREGAKNVGKDSSGEILILMMKERMLGFQI